MKISTLLILICALGSVSAEQPASPPASRPKSLGQVTGSVICRDTGGPGRFASIELLSDQEPPTPSLPEFNPGNLARGSDFSKRLSKEVDSAMNTAFRALQGSNLTALTGLDGRFALEKVPAGTYYVIVQLEGYRSPVSGLSLRERMRPDTGTLAAVKSAAQKIVVLAGETTRIRVQLDRGAALSGTVNYSDGSPALGVVPRLLRQGPDGEWTEVSSSGPLSGAMTDDRGGFRFDGLSAGRYAVEAALPTTQATIVLGLGQLPMRMATGDALVVYSGGALRQSDIAPIDLTNDSNRTGVKVVFPLEGLHTLSGRVLAQSDHHPVNFATIELQDPQTKQSVRTMILSEDGTFTLRYVADGQYLLKVTSAADMQHGPGVLPCPLGCREIREYASTALPLTVRGDRSDLVLQVPGSAANQPGGDPPEH